MNNSYFSSSINDYSNSFDYSFQYSSPSTSTYSYSSLPPCPVHSPYYFYTSTPSMNLSSPSYTYYQQPQQQQQYQLQVYSSPPSHPIQQQTTIISDADRTPLRRHRCFKKNQLQILHQAYNHDPHPSTDVLQQLATQLKAPVDKVRQWFKNRRHSDKQKKRTIATTIQTSTNA